MLTELSEQLSVWAIPAVLLIIPIVGYLRKVKVYEAFIEGAAEGFQTAIRIIPCLVAMLVAISIFRASGAMDACVALLAPLLDVLGVPADLVPLAIMRPLSGSGSLGMATEILNTYGPDSLVGRIASTVLASTDTTFYVLTVYFGAVSISNPRYALLVGLSGDIASFLLAVYLCQYLFTS
ncbi:MULTISPECIES: spore maturation protein [Sporomusa]|jgi:spore maturation protein B|uniref:Spore maturation protein B n=1 Tax=Sporomusa sphaeroides DSM 2875 TaxID=1337886 RepID=A0ABP2C213_9FIRM|nr:MULTISPECIES: nucleoside recognition domain-containing protein [Sporomusa]OLS58312.1 spore maturation protein B [Sporomusa sphaeroides DSM 2875]CVK17501.1 Spore maturation protein B [Sporomusa sphaeroides DSM 2875]HML31619.1 nucleoside recognition domain-containing protein [Sporomusa sphaeroides]